MVVVVMELISWRFIEIGKAIYNIDAFFCQYHRFLLREKIFFSVVKNMR